MSASVDWVTLIACFVGVVIVNAVIHHIEMIAGSSGGGWAGAAIVIEDGRQAFSFIVSEHGVFMIAHRCIIRVLDSCIDVIICARCIRSVCLIHIVQIRIRIHIRIHIIHVLVHICAQKIAMDTAIDFFK